MADEAQPENEAEQQGISETQEQPGNERARKTRRQRSFPSASFEESLRLPKAVLRLAPDGKVRRLTLLNDLKISQTSSATQTLLSNGVRYGLTTGNYKGDFIEVTPSGKTLLDESTDVRTRFLKSFELAIDKIEPLKLLYDKGVGKRLAAPEVMRDDLRESGIPDEHLNECVDLFIENTTYLKLLQVISGTQTLVTVDYVLEDVLKYTPSQAVAAHTQSAIAVADSGFANTCFYISPIGDEGTEFRTHSDVILNNLVVPALRDFGLQVIRADQIGESGIITNQVLEYVMRSRLAVVDLSWRNPNVYYEMAIRHVCQLPTILIARKDDVLPFDISNMRVIFMDTTGPYSLLPQLETYKSLISAQARAALDGTELPNNPVSVYGPRFRVIFE